MKIVQFSVTNYRSITTGNKIALQDLTVLVGKNNEGKSNFLRALNIAMTIIIRHGKYPSTSIRYFYRHLYDWERDFPIHLQNRGNKLDSVFKLDFQLSQNELSEFHELTGIRGNEIIPIAVKIGRDNIPKLEVPKKGSPAYKEQMSLITDFVSRRISFNYIQAIRTEEMAKQALSEAIYSELSMLENNEEYVEALNTINKLEETVLNEMSQKIIEPLKIFLPSLTTVSIKRGPDRRDGFSRHNDIDVIIDDGQATTIENKGDGIKSLVALAILQDRSNNEGTSLVAIEEPESHLHSGAIHSLVEVINKMTESNQVIITTHNPLFVNQNKIATNIIIDKGTVKPARSISEIRELLGVQASDNLRNSNHVLVVEGEDDKVSLQKILPLLCNTLKFALNNNQLVIKPLLGASNLSHDLLDLRNNMCQYVVLLDNDKAGREAAEKAEQLGYLKSHQIRYTICNSLLESEFEDCIKVDVYKERLETEFGVNLKCKEFKTKDKWSDRMRNVFLSQGLLWNDTIKRKVKTAVAECVAASDDNISKIVIKEKGSFLKGLVQLIEKMMD